MRVPVSLDVQKILEGRVVKSEIRPFIFNVSNAFELDKKVSRLTDRDFPTHDGGYIRISQNPYLPPLNLPVDSPYGQLVLSRRRIRIKGRVITNTMGRFRFDYSRN